MTKPKNNRPHNPKELSWLALEFRPYRKTTAWYIGFAVIAGFLIVYGIFRGGIISLITFLVILTATYIYAHRKPKTITHQLTEDGVIIDQAFFPYKALKLFWFAYNPPEVKTVNFETTFYLNRELRLELGEQNPLEVRDFLSRFLMEDFDRQESISDIIIRKSKF